MGEQLLAQDAILYTEAYYVLGVTSFFQGEFGRARTQLVEALRHYDLANSPIHITRYAQDPKVVCLCRLALVLWYLGYPDQAQQMTADALIFAPQLAHPFSLVYCLYWNAMVQQHCGLIAAMQERIATGADLIHMHQLGTFAHWLTSLHGWALAEQGNVTEGLVQLHASIEQARVTGAQNLECFNLGLLAEAYGKQGAFDHDRQCIDESQARVAKTGERWCAAEGYRWQGELRRRQQGSNNDWVEIEEAFQQALAIAQSQGTKSLELRAAVSLARLWLITITGRLPACSEPCVESSIARKIHHW